MKTLTRKDICTPMFIAALFIIAKILKKAKCPLMAEWIKKMWLIHTYTHTQKNVNSAIKKEGNLAICDNIDGSREHYAKWNKSDK